MNPCPECGSTDRHQEEDRYALITATDNPAGGTKLDLDLPKTGGYIVKLIACRNCGAIALTTNPG